MRKWAIKEAHREGKSLGDTLREASKNTELKELRFTSQVALTKHERPDEPWAKWALAGNKTSKGSGRTAKARARTRPTQKGVAKTIGARSNWATSGTTW